MHAEEAARAFETLSIDDAARLLKKLPTRDAVALLQRLVPFKVGPILEKLEKDRIRDLLTPIPPRVAAGICQHLDEAHRDEILGELGDQVVRPIRHLLDYPGDTAGGMMEPKVASLSIDLTAQQAISTIRKSPREVLHYLYVTDREGHLIGVLSMRDLLLAASRDPIETLVHRDVVSVPATTPRDEVLSIMRERRFLALPVVDFENRLVGVVRHSDALAAGQVEAFEELQKIVGAGADERALSPVSRVVKSRLPWLYVNLLTAFMAAAVVGMFEGIIARIAALAVLLPVVAGQGGNTGSQALAVVMRGIALREIIPGLSKRVLIKETLGGLVNGIAVALVTAGAVFVWRKIAGDSVTNCAGLALVIGLAMIVNMVAAALSGAAIPLILKAVGRDPAQSAAIFLTTVTDIVGFASFLGFAVVFSSLLL
jgi:magnesium transporter